MGFNLNEHKIFFIYDQKSLYVEYRYVTNKFYDLQEESTDGYNVLNEIKSHLDEFIKISVALDAKNEAISILSTYFIKPYPVIIYDFCT